MKLLILSDLHAEFRTFEAPQGLDYDVAVLAGDIMAPGRAAPRWLRNPARFPDKPVILVAGNHEFYDTVMPTELADMRRAAAENGVHFLDCDEVVIEGVRFLGCTLWTDFRLRIDQPSAAGQPAALLSDQERAMEEGSRFLNDYVAIRVEEPQPSNARGARRLVPMDTLKVHRRHRAWLRRKLAEPFAGPTIVVTHHAPHRNSLATRFAGDWSSGAFVSEMNPEFFQVPSLWIHGHTHNSFDYQVGTCRVVCNPRGYVDWNGRNENRNFDAALMLEVATPAVERMPNGGVARPAEL